MSGIGFSGCSPYDGPETFEEVNDRYWASPKRLALGLEADDYIVDWDMRMVDQVTW